ncbi:MAG: MBL fold metallo-hydrolase [Nitrospira sp.]|nr:MBL fold metallo-hydrolase [Nitrospira sp.]
MKLGAFDIYAVTDGRFRLDGGAMFGVVPKALWQKCCPADELNRIPLHLNCLLIQAHGKNVLVDTGLGDKEDAKFHSMFAVERMPSLRDSLQRHGLTHDDIHLVINTHLHFDHAGGNTVANGNGLLRSAFPKATYYVQQGEYDDAVAANERTRASYRRNNFSPVAQLNQWEFLRGDTELLPGITTMVTAGHTPFHQSVKVESKAGLPSFWAILFRRSRICPSPTSWGTTSTPCRRSTPSAGCWIERSRRTGC